MCLRDSGPSVAVLRKLLPLQMLVLSLQSDSGSHPQHKFHVICTRELDSASQKFLFAFLGSFRWHSLSQTPCSLHSGFSLLWKAFCYNYTVPSRSSFLKHCLTGSPICLLGFLPHTSWCHYGFKVHLYYPRAAWVHIQYTWHPLSSPAYCTGFSGMV